MYTKFFFERFWEGEQRNELFVCMPFHDLFDSRLENHNWTESKRVKAAAESIDDIGLSLMWNIGRHPKGWNEFNTLTLPPLEKMSVLRLIDLGIIRGTY